MRLSVLDQSTASKGKPQDVAIRETLELARYCDALGFHRYWLSEHHNSGSIVGTAPEILMAAIAAHLRPIGCIGETVEEREGGDTLAVLDRQIRDGLDTLTGDQVGSLVMAYEPVWAIGTGRNATPAQAGEAHAHIRTRLRQWFGGNAADLCHVIYGGSVKPDNIRELSSIADVDGALVGGASLDVRGFFDIVSRGRAASV